MAAGAPAQACIFCRIVRGELASAIIEENDRFVAFLDHQPLFPGHCLVVPRQHVDTMLDLPADVAGDLFVQAQVVARAVEQAMVADGTFIAINNRVSQSVPHVHIHVIPRRFGDGLKGFLWPRQPYASAEDMAQTRDKIRAALKRATE